MTNLEYEHSFSVKSVEPFINYCKNNGYLQQSVVTQNRVVYENKHNSKIIARLTTEFSGEKQTTVIDFKNVNAKKDDLNISTESIPLVVTPDNKNCIMSILQTLNFVEAANNLRTRYVFVKDGVTFEIDNYTRPQMQVVAIEGQKQQVERVYEDIKNNKIGEIL